MSAYCGTRSPPWAVLVASRSEQLRRSRHTHLGKVVEHPILGETALWEVFCEYDGPGIMCRLFLTPVLRVG